MAIDLSGMALPREATTTAEHSKKFPGPKSVDQEVTDIIYNINVMSSMPIVNELKFFTGHITPEALKILKKRVVEDRKKANQHFPEGIGKVKFLATPEGYWVIITDIPYVEIGLVDKANHICGSLNNMIMHTPAVNDQIVVHRVEWVSAGEGYVQEIVREFFKQKGGWKDVLFFPDTMGTCTVIMQK